MTGRRIAYGGFLIGALLLQILYDGYWGGFLFLLALALPVLSLLLTLPLLFQGQLQVLPSQEHLQRGKEGQWELHFQSRFPLILPGLRLQMAERNELTGETRRFQVLLLGAQTGELGQIPMTNQQCGYLTCVIHRAALLDCLGLFALPVGHTGNAYAWVDPVPAAVPNHRRNYAPTVGEIRCGGFIGSCPVNGTNGLCVSPRCKQGGRSPLPSIIGALMRNLKRYWMNWLPLPGRFLKTTMFAVFSGSIPRIGRCRIGL